MNIANLLSWKFNDAEGIETVDGVLTRWPRSLGEWPTQEALDKWQSECDLEQQKDPLEKHIENVELNLTEILIIKALLGDETAKSQLEEILKNNDLT